MLKQLLKIPLISALAIVAWSAAITPAAAGGGPENVFLVVNPNSPDSLIIANNYIHLRHIPPGNVFYLPWAPKPEEILIDEFRTKILSPIIEAIRARRLSAQIDYVIYSSDFPWRIYLESDINKFKEMPQLTNRSISAGRESQKIGLPPSAIFLNPQVAKYGSLNGMTYLWQSVLKGTPDYFDLQSNRYTRMPSDEQKEMPTLCFRNSWEFGAKGELLESGGNSYYLSAMLGVTFGRGNSVSEILQYLKRSASADGSHPQGTIYFVKNQDIRSVVRHDHFPEAVKELEKLGVSAQIIKGTVPLNKNDVQGVQMGCSDFNWEGSGSTILPGAICEHFTSYGGNLRTDTSQTPLSEFLRYGAAGSSGTVGEPTAIWAKFPLPMIQVHYARGCSLAEAFYQSVYAPYQLLIVGDPLCRPWANIPTIKVPGLKPNYIVKNTLTLSPTATTPSGKGIDHFELFVNGSRAAMCKPGGTLTLDTTLLPDGYHDLRVVAFEAGLIQSQGRVILPIITNNYGRKIEATVTAKGPIRSDNPLIIDVNSPGSISVSVLQNSRIVGRLSGDKGQIKIEAKDLGAGPVRLQAIGIGQGGPQSHVMALPIDVSVELSETSDKKTPS
jgi:hypothetical protein